ncbi:PAC2 family protein [Propionibacteriaceae bacterium Y2011]|uniref:PAC2 family protein n=1 Tax=Microlunatus sp. Y2014 TaxID=3418488 RepID=UPI003B4EDBD9
MADQIEPLDLRDLVDPLVVMAFSGWNDAGLAATQTVEHLQEVAEARELFTLDPEEFYDFQVHRPQVSRPDPTETTIHWPATTLSTGVIGGRHVLFISGPEPNFRWRAYANQLMSGILSARPSMVVLLGALLADTPHTRPIPVSGSASDLRLADDLGLELSTYEGPTGILGVMTQACQQADLDTVSLWAAVPHYVSSSPCPKATLALVHRLEDLLDTPLEQGELPDLARAWERGVAELAEDDTEIAEYVAGLEQEQDAAELPEATGDAIAAEFQRYLRRRNQT